MGPRRYNAVADDLANAAMDGQCDWQWEDAALVETAKSGNARIKICVDGGLRRSAHNQAAMGIAIFLFLEGEYKPIFYAASLITDVHSSFLAECLALDQALALWKCR